MKKIIHPIYRDYPRQPYISPERNLALWNSHPENFPYKKVERKQMEELELGLLPGDIVMLWRIHFNTFTNETVIPQYFEYRYGVNSNESLALLLTLGLIENANATDSLDLLTTIQLKSILSSQNLHAKGKKENLLNVVKENLTESSLEKLFHLRRYKITPHGTEILNKHQDIIQRHGTK